jgi:hypothetical protein
MVLAVLFPFLRLMAMTGPGSMVAWRFFIFSVGQVLIASPSLVGFAGSSEVRSGLL